MRYLYTLLAVLLISTAVTAKPKMLFGFDFGVGPTWYGGETMITKNAITSTGVTFKFVVDGKRVQFGFGAEALVDNGQVMAYHIAPNYYTGGDSIEYGVSEDVYLTPHILLNYKFIARDKIYAYAGVSLGIPLIPDNEDINPIRYGAQMGVAIKLVKKLHVVISERWRYVHQDDHYNAPAYSSYSTHSSGPYFFNSLTTCVGLRVGFGSKR